MATTAIPHGKCIDLVLTNNVVTVGEVRKALSEKLQLDVNRIHIVHENNHNIPDGETIFSEDGKLHFVHINRQLLYGRHDTKITLVMTTEPHVIDEDGKVKAITIYSKVEGHPDLTFETIRLSCKSHEYTPDADFAGFILYGWKPPNTEQVKTKWELGGKRCKSAYMVIQNTTSPDVKRYMGMAPGMVHGAVYWNVFGKGEDPRQAEGEGFSVRNLKDSAINNPWNSGVFNANPGAYHGSKKQISVLGHVIVKYIINKWEKNSAAIGSTYSVGDILSGKI